MTYALWVIQGLLAALFLLAGGMKLVPPLDQLTGPVPLPGWFVRFIGVAEVLGGIGLVVPGLVGIRPGLTPLAAIGLLVVMVGAVVITLAGGDMAPALIPTPINTSSFSTSTRKESPTTLAFGALRGGFWRTDGLERERGHELTRERVAI